jgi:tetratricopeptide (TPR) repeat protein
VTTLRASLFVLVLSGTAYANSLGNGFAYDDNQILVQNPVVTQGDWARALSSPYQPDALEGAGLYRPLTSLSFALEWKLFGGRPLGFHLANVLIHALVGLMVFAFLLEVSTVGPAFLGAALFVVHPLHAEAVANVVGRAELYCALFFLMACILYWKGGFWTGWRRAIRLVGLGVLYGLALTSKEMGVTLPAALLLLEVARGRGGTVRQAQQPSPGDVAGGPDGQERFLGRVGREGATYALLIAVCLAYLAFRTMAVGTLKGEVVDPVFRLLSPGQRVLTALSLWPHYLRLLLFPLDLAADYGPGVLFPAEGVNAGVMLGLAVLAGAALVAIRDWRNSPFRPLLALGILWFALTVVPVSNLLFPVGTILAERTLYLPSVGLALGAAGVAQRVGWMGMPLRSWATAALVLVVGGLLVRTVLRNPAWESTYAVLETLNREHPESHLAFLNRGVGLDLAGDTAAAEPEFAMAVRLAPERYGTLTAAAGFLGRVGRWGEAEELLVRAMTLAPSRDDAYRLLATQLLRQGRGREAHRVALEGLARAGFHPDLWAAVSESYLLRGDLDAAFRARQAALVADPGSALQMSRMGDILEALGREEDAAAVRKKARTLSEASGAGERTGGGEINPPPAVRDDRTPMEE